MRGQPVDRPAVNFYEIGGLKIDPTDPDPLNVYHDPSWRPLLELAEAETDLIRLRSPVRVHSHQAWAPPSVSDPPTARQELVRTETSTVNGCLLTRTEIRIGGRRLTSVTRRDPNLDTLWTVEHLLRGAADLRAYLELPDDFFAQRVDVEPLETEEQQLGDAGIVMIDTEDPLCAAATLFDMEIYTILAFSEPALFHRLLQKLAAPIHRRTEQVARQLPGRLWRIYGPEYASEPFLPPRCFEEYVVRYTGPMVGMIQRHGGWVRLHCHGRIRNILDHMVAMGIDAIDPIEPPPHGDVSLEMVRRRYGQQLVLFGNLEVADIEHMEPAKFDRLVQRTLEEGTAVQGRGFVLMPSSSPCGRKLSRRALQNYETMVQRAKAYA
jgi:hypothetical protein